MRANLANDGAGALESALSWWRLAGVDVLVDDSPRDWLRPQPAVVPQAPSAAPTPQPDTLPATLPDFQQWLQLPENLPFLGARRIAPQGDPAAPFMLLTDQPDAEDIESEALFSGAAGRLLDAMLHAIGLDRSRIYIAGLLPGQSPVPREDGPDSEIARIVRHHIGLIRPKALLLMGDATVRALSGTGFARARGGKLDLNHGSGTCPGIATFHPRFLLRHPAMKADAWADLRRFSEYLHP